MEHGRSCGGMFGRPVAERFGGIGGRDRRHQGDHGDAGDRGDRRSDGDQQRRRQCGRDCRAGAGVRQRSRRGRRRVRRRRPRRCHLRGAGTRARSAGVLDGVHDRRERLRRGAGAGAELLADQALRLPVERRARGERPTRADRGAGRDLRADRRRPDGRFRSCRCRCTCGEGLAIGFERATTLAARSRRW